MDILFWLLPPVVVTALAMVWVSWVGREARGEVDREEALARLGAALEGEPRRGRAPGYAAPPRPVDHGSGVAVRSAHPEPAKRAAPEDGPTGHTEPPAERRAS